MRDEAKTTAKIAGGVAGVVATVLVVVAPGFGFGGLDLGRSTSGARDGPRSEVTFADDIAPIVERECVVCHNAEGSAPFSLTRYDQVRDKADRIARATTARAMPPWLPAAEPGTFAGERILTEEEIGKIRSWVEAGSPPGDTARLELSAEQAGWDPGEPDLVVGLPSIQLPADGADRYRNLVVSIPVPERRWVEYVELRPGSRTAVHHARMMIDTTRSSAELAAEDPEPGFDGMDLLSSATNPPGHFIGWTPGKTRLEPLEGMAWPLEPGTDLVVQLHLRTTGEPEEVAAEVAFHFADEPARRHPAVLVVSSLIIDIPPGEPEYTVSNSFTLPVDVEVLSVYPHAHFLGKDLQAYAILPDGRERSLIRIPDWDFNWQDDYRFARPLSLPAGTQIVKRFVYDNSAGNPRNPSDPPKRVVYGSNSDDEMADLILQVLPQSDADRETLLRAQAWQHESEDMAYLAHVEHAAGAAALANDDLDEATHRFQEALQYRADHVPSLVGLARTFGRRGDWSSSLLIARQAELMSGGSDARALDVLSAAQAAVGDVPAAVASAQQGLTLARASGDDALAAVFEARLRQLGG
ncbi:MAG: hypothetical protein HKN72_05260 [Gemmatimonadetes bacterium]|nr:hypothetical protein [Gemmatimonadota bacterium]